MNVRLISHSTSVVPELQGLGPEADIIYIARVSSTRDDKTENIAGLIRYLIRNRHWSPFEMASMCVEIVTSRAISLQIVRHRSFSFQQLSQRYTASMATEPVQLRLQAATNRQSSTDVTDPVIDGIPASVRIENHIQQGVGLYQDLLDAGVAKETARFVLPETMETRLYMHGTVRSWIHYLEVRDDAHAQLEHQEIAQAIKTIFVQLYPLTAEALGWTPSTVNPS